METIVNIGLVVMWFIWYSIVFFVGTMIGNILAGKPYNKNWENKLIVSMIIGAIGAILTAILTN